MARTKKRPQREPGPVGLNLLVDEKVAASTPAQDAQAPARLEWYDGPRAEDMSPAVLEDELERVRHELHALMSPAEAKAEMHRLHGELAELEVIAIGGDKKKPPTR